MAALSKSFAPSIFNQDRPVPKNDDEKRKHVTTMSIHSTPKTLQSVLSTKNPHDAQKFDQIFVKFLD